VLSYAVTERAREIGIRMSLGASRGRALASFLHEVTPADPMILVLTAGLLAVVALVACYLPARRAARLDPMAALRYEYGAIVQTSTATV
jgi:ABC-type antimicrobial peptide transport system permease subunit